MCQLFMVFTLFISLYLFDLIMYKVSFIIVNTKSIQIFMDSRKFSPILQDLMDVLHLHGGYFLPPLQWSHPSLLRAHPFFKLHPFVFTKTNSLIVFYLSTLRSTVYPLLPMIWPPPEPPPPRNKEFIMVGFLILNLIIVNISLSPWQLLLLFRCQQRFIHLPSRYRYSTPYSYFLCQICLLLFMFTCFYFVSLSFGVYVCTLGV